MLLLIDNVYRLVQAGGEVSGLLGRLPSRVGYQPTLATEVAELEERIASVAGTAITSIQAVYWFMDGVAKRLATRVQLEPTILRKGDEGFGCGSPLHQVHRDGSSTGELDMADRIFPRMAFPENRFPLFGIMR